MLLFTLPTDDGNSSYLRSPPPSATVNVHWDAGSKYITKQLSYESEITTGNVSWDVFGHEGA